MKTVCVFIRARNEAQEIGQTLLRVSAQRRRPDEVIVLDTESEDGTPEVAIGLGAKVHRISRDEFTYGRALNLALELSQCEIIVFLSAHSPPMREDWLQNLLAPVEASACRVTYGRQVPMPGVNPLEEWFTRWTFPRHPGRLRTRLRLQNPAFSNANSAVLRSLLIEVPFREDLAFAEDREWAARLNAQREAVYYCPNAPVYHSHSPTGLRKRMEDVGRAKSQQGEGRTYLNPLLRIFLWIVIVSIDTVYCMRNGYWRTIPTIVHYRNEYFRGLLSGLRIPTDDARGFRGDPPEDSD